MQAPSPRRIVIVGAGHSGTNAAAMLRQQGFEGEVLLLSDESHVPYQRPPLSKDFLKAKLPAHELLLKPEPFYAEQRIDLRLGVTVESLDLAAKSVSLGSGEQLWYDALILATGAAPRRLAVPGTNLTNVWELRTRGDAETLAAMLKPGSRIAIVGGGYVGLEVAASANHRGVEPLVLERESRVLARVSSPELATWLTEHHQAQGTQIITNADVACIVDDGLGTVQGIKLSDGRSFDCDVALIGVGALPRIGLAEAAGLACDGGIVVDHNAWTGVEDVYAIGDVTRRPLHHYEGSHRLESIPSALEQAKQAVHAILGQDRPKPELPWFWSDQFDVKLKMAGLVSGIETTVLRGDPTSARCAWYHCVGDRIVAVESVNNASDFIAGKHLIERAAPVDVARLADTSVSLREIAA